MQNTWQPGRVSLGVGAAEVLELVVVAVSIQTYLLRWELLASQASSKVSR